MYLADLLLYLLQSYCRIVAAGQWQESGIAYTKMLEEFGTVGSIEYIKYRDTTLNEIYNIHSGK